MIRDQPNKIMMNLNNAKSSTYRHTHNEQITRPMCIVEKATQFLGLPTIHTKLKHKMEMGKIHTHTPPMQKIVLQEHKMIKMYTTENGLLKRTFCIAIGLVCGNHTMFVHNKILVHGKSQLCSNAEAYLLLRLLLQRTYITPCMCV